MNRKREPTLPMSTPDGRGTEEIYHIDPIRDCPRCGLNKNYHTKIHPCSARRNPYKLKDGTDLQLGMRVWVYWQHGDATGTIITGVVRFITGWGSMRIILDPPDRDEKNFNGLMHSIPFLAKHGFSTREAAENFMTKHPPYRQGSTNDRPTGTNTP